MIREKISSLCFLSTLRAAQNRLQCVSVHAHKQIDKLLLDRLVHTGGCLRAFATSAPYADSCSGNPLAKLLVACADASKQKSPMVNQLGMISERESGNDVPPLEGRSDVVRLPSIPEATPSSDGGDVFSETEGSEDDDALTLEKESSAEEVDIVLFGPLGKNETVISMYQILKVESWNSPETEQKLANVARRLNPDSVIAVVKLLKNAHSALSFLNWAKEQEGYEPRAEAFTHVIARFGRERNFNSAWRLLLEMKGCKLPINFAYSIFLHRLKRAKRAKGLVKAMCGMKFLGVRPTVALYTSALEYLLKVSAAEDAIHLYKQMLKDGLIPDKKLFEVLVVGFVQIGKLDDALLLFNDMKDRGYVPHVSVYSALSSSLSVTESLEKGHELYEEMIGTGCLPKVFGVHEIACALHGDDTMEMVERFLKVVQRAPYKWKKQSHNNLLQCLLDSGRCNEAKVIFDSIPRDQEAKFKAKSKVPKGGAKCYWNLDSYRIYIIGMCRLAQLPHAMDTFKELLDRHLKPTNEISSFLLLSLSKAKMIDEALVFCNYLIGEREVVSVDAQHSFFGALRTSGHLSVAVKIFASMKRKGCIDQDADFVSVIGLETKDDVSSML